MDTVVLRSFNQVQLSLYNFFQSNNPNVLLKSGAGTGPGDLLDDIGQEFGNGIYVILTFLQEIKSVAGLLRLVSGSSGEAVFLNSLQAALGYSNTQMAVLLQQVVTDKGSDYDLTLNPATSSTLNLRFYTSVYGSGLGSIPQGTTSQTSGVSPIQYGTVTAIVNNPLIGPDPVNGQYYIDSAAQALIPGASSQVPVGAVNQLIPPISGFTSVVNTTASAGGVNQESLRAFLLRIQAAEKGRELGTIPGLESFIGAQAGVQDVFVVDATNPLMTRGDENQVDAWVMGSNDQAATDTVTYYAALMNGAIVMNNQPVVSVTSVVVGAVTQVVGVNYNFVKDTQGFSGSVRGMDSIVWITPPLDGSVVTINYLFNDLISVLQNLLAITDPSNYLLNSDILIRAAVAVYINITDLVVPTANYSKLQMETGVTTAMESFFDTFLLGAQIYQSDATDVIDGTPGVGHSEPFVLFAPVGEVGASDQLLGPNQYPVLNTFTFL